MWIDFKELCASIDLRDAARLYGVESKSDMIHCLLSEHADKSPSMKLYSDNYFCFGCGCSGDVINFTSMLFNIDFYAAAVKLSQDFGFIPGKSKEYVSKKSLCKEQDSKIKRAFDLIRGYLKYLNDCKAEHEPRILGEPLHPQFAEALDNLGKYEYYHDYLLDSNREQRLWFIENSKDDFEKIELIIEAHRLKKESAFIKYQKMFVEIDCERVQEKQKIEINQNNSKGKKTMENSKPNVNIRATAYLIESENAGKLKANATVTVNDTMIVRNIKVVEGEDGLIVNMPSRKVGEEWRDVVAPASKEAYAQIKQAVLEAYAAAVELAEKGIEPPLPELNPADIEVEVWKMRDNRGDNKTIANCVVKVADTFIINDVKIQEGGELGLKVQMPGEWGDEKWHETVKVFDNVVRDTVLDAYIAHEENKVNLIGNTEFNNLADNYDDVGFKTYSGELAEKVSAALDAAGIAWSGKINPEKQTTSFSYNVKDEMTVNKAIQAVKSPSKEKFNNFKDRLDAKKAQAAERNGNKSPPSKSNNRNNTEEL
jgi:DNA-binding cell septation regulator SpoVG